MNKFRIKLAVGKTYNTGNYQSLRLDVGIEADVEPGDEIAKKFIELTNTLEHELRNQEYVWGVSKP